MLKDSFRLLTIFVIAIISQVNAEKQKRQIFREQVLPSQGGKIPEGAFRADRLALNRLNKEGITVPDGVVLEARHVHKHENPSVTRPEVLKVYLTPDGRYVPREGRYNYENPKSVDTTYLVRHPVFGKYRNTHHNYFNKPQSYSGLRQFPQAFKPTLTTPLVIPTRDEVLQNTFYPTWSPEYSWDFFYDPFNDFFVNSIDVFNSHQIITDYEGFLHDFHERSLRHIAGSNGGKSEGKTLGNFLATGRTGGFNPSSESSEGFRSSGLTISESNGYPGLKEIPETRFICGDKRGTFADVETKCQIFHRCGPGGKSSFLCTAGTIFSETKKRCEWWNTVACNSAFNFN